jgi:hypothetical protein
VEASTSHQPPTTHRRMERSGGSVAWGFPPQTTVSSLEKLRKSPVVFSFVLTAAACAIPLTSARVGSPVAVRPRPHLVRLASHQQILRKFLPYRCGLCSCVLFSMRTFRVGPTRPAVKLQCKALRANKVTSRFVTCPPIMASGIAEDCQRDSAPDFHPSMRIPPGACPRLLPIVNVLHIAHA